jgi:hypothetical protein
MVLDDKLVAQHRRVLVGLFAEPHFGRFPKRELLATGATQKQRVNRYDQVFGIVICPSSTALNASQSSSLLLSLTQTRVSK